MDLPPGDWEEIVFWGPGGVYGSCKPASLARDLRIFKREGYQGERGEARVCFPRTVHVETVVLLSKGEVDSKKIRVEFSLEDMDMSEFQDGGNLSADQGSMCWSIPG